MKKDSHAEVVFFLFVLFCLLFLRGMSDCKRGLGCRVILVMYWWMYPVENGYFFLLLGMLKVILKSVICTLRTLSSISHFPLNSRVPSFTSLLLHCHTPRRWMKWALNRRKGERRGGWGNRVNKRVNKNSQVVSLSVCACRLHAWEYADTHLGKLCILQAINQC